MDPLSAATLLMLSSFLFWNLLYIACKAKIPDQSPEYYSRAVTLLHGSVATIVGIAQCDPMNLNMCRFTTPILSQHYALMVWSWGYFAFDLLWCLIYWNEGPLMFCHHTVALLAITMYLHKVATGCTFACTLALMEITNPLLQTRWFLKNSGHEKTKIYLFIEVTYIVSFFLARGVVGSYLLYLVMTRDIFPADQKLFAVALHMISIALMWQIMSFIMQKYRTRIVPAARAPAEGTVCALLRGASRDCVRDLLPALVARIGRDPPPTALPHAMLQTIPLHNLVDLLFDPAMIGESENMERAQSSQLRAALCLARAAGPAAVLTAVRRRLADTARADVFCNKLRERLSKPVEKRTTHVSRSSLLPIPVRRRARSTPSPAAPARPRRLRPLPDSAPLPSVSQSGRKSILKTLSLIPLSDKDSSALTATCEDEIKEKGENKMASAESLVLGETTVVDIPVEEVDDAPPPPPHSPSICIEDYSEKSVKSLDSQIEISQYESSLLKDAEAGSQKSLKFERTQTPFSRSQSRQSSPSPPSSRSRSEPASPTKNGQQTPEPVSYDYDQKNSICERDVRSALTECIVPAKHEDWEVIVNALAEAERLAADGGARAPVASWRAVVRSAAAHVRSLRSRVARTACSTIGALFEHRGRSLDPELEDSMSALLERCADVNRFLRADAASALGRVACGSSGARAAAALARRGAGHRAAPVRAAAAQALTRLVERLGVARALDLPPEARAHLLRAAGELLGDASAETRLHARLLCLALLEDDRFRPMLKESMQPSRYRAIEKIVDKLR